MSKAMLWRSFTCTMLAMIVVAIAGQLWSNSTVTGVERVSMLLGLATGWLYRSYFAYRTMTAPDGKPETVALVNQASESR